MQSVADTVFSIKRELDARTKVRVYGWSMSPLIEYGDWVIIDHSSTRLRPGDVVAYKVDNRIIVHRVLGVRGTDKETVYLCRGDSNTKLDPRVRSSSVLGEVVRVVKLGREIDLTTPYRRMIGHAVVTVVLWLRRFGLSQGATRPAKVVRKFAREILALAWSA